MAVKPPEALCFIQQTGGAKASLSASAEGLTVRLGAVVARIPWSDVVRLDLVQEQVQGTPVGAARLESAGGLRVAWTDPELLFLDTKTPSARPPAPAPPLEAAQDDGVPRLMLTGGLALVPIVIEKAGLVEQADGSFARLAAQAPAPPPLPHTPPEEVAPPRPPRSKRVVQIVLLALGVLVFSAMQSFEFAVALLVYLFIHEYGHVVAMKACGVTVRGIFILPGFGAAAVADEEAATRWREFIIAVMGPVFGIAVTVAALVAYVVTGGRYDALGQACLWYAFINVFNLLPLGLLDGGRIVGSIAYSTHRAVGAVASIATVVLCAMAAVFLQSWLLGLVAFFALGAFRNSKRTERANQALLSTGCTPAGFRAALAATWERIGRLPVEGDGFRELKARRTVATLKAYRGFFRGSATSTGMNGIQIALAVAGYAGILLVSLILVVAALLLSHYLPAAAP